ncbi:MAG TPA: thioesterase family protein [Baekduia sp.]|nr:thioesterase family protein [Baekduia sp.]
MPYVHRLRVRFNECDPQGIVFNANFLVYADVAGNELWRDELGGYDAFQAAGYDIVVAEANVRYFGPARFDEVLDVAISIDRIGTTSFLQRFGMSRDGDPVAEVLLRYVCIDAGGRPVAVPEDLRERLTANLTNPLGAPS